MRRIFLRMGLRSSSQPAPHALPSSRLHGDGVSNSLLNPTQKIPRPKHRHHSVYVRDFAVLTHAQRISQWNVLDRQLFGVIRLAVALLQFTGEIDVIYRSGNAVDRVGPAERFPTLCSKARFFAQLALGGVEQLLATFG